MTKPTISAYFGPFVFHAFACNETMIGCVHDLIRMNINVMQRCFDFAVLICHNASLQKVVSVHPFVHPSIGLFIHSSVRLSQVFFLLKKSWFLEPCNSLIKLLEVSIGTSVCRLTICHMLFLTSTSATATMSSEKRKK